MTKDTHRSDDVLLRRMMAGDDEAFTLLYRRRHPAIYRFALHMTGNLALAEDVTQEVFMALIRGAGNFDPSRGTVGGFLFGIARNHLRKRWHQDRRLEPLGSEDAHGSNGMGNTNGTGSNGTTAPAEAAYAGARSTSDTHEEYLANETAARVRHAVSTLPENYREVVILCELEEMSYEEAAAALDCPLGTVRSRLHRARTMLIEKLRGVRTMARGAAAVNE